MNQLREEAATPASKVDEQADSLLDILRWTVRCQRTLRDCLQHMLLHLRRFCQGHNLAQHTFASDSCWQQRSGCVAFSLLIAVDCMQEKMSIDDAELQAAKQFSALRAGSLSSSKAAPAVRNAIRLDTSAPKGGPAAKKASPKPAPVPLKKHQGDSTVGGQVRSGREYYDKWEKVAQEADSDDDHAPAAPAPAPAQDTSKPAPALGDIKSEFFFGASQTAFM